MELIVGQEWDTLARLLSCIRGTAIVMGGVDAGKSTLVKYLARRLLYSTGKVSIVDSDIGQSSLGLPGIISMKIFRGPKALRKFWFQKMLFVGVTNPAKAMESLVTGTKRLVEVCRMTSDVVLVDTTGLVTGALGRALKVRKVQAIMPDHVIALQRKDELEHILEDLSGIRVHRVTISEFARTRSRAERIRYRQARFDAYFGRPLYSFHLRRDEAVFLRNDKSFSLGGESVVPAGSLVGLNHGRYTLALGIIDEISGKALKVLSPVRSIRKVNKILFGDILYKPGENALH